MLNEAHDDNPFEPVQRPHPIDTAFDGSRLGYTPSGNDGSPIHNTQTSDPFRVEPLKMSDAFIANRTLSRIEELEEEDQTSYNLRMSHLRTPDQQMTDRSIDDISPQDINYNPALAKSAPVVAAETIQEVRHIPQIVMDVAKMENDFSSFLESIYNN